MLSRLFTISHGICKRFYETKMNLINYYCIGKQSNSRCRGWQAGASGWGRRTRRSTVG
jgi:hypothetical protein